MMTLIAICAHLLILLKVAVWDGGLSGVTGGLFIDLLRVLVAAVGGACQYAR